MSAQTKLMTKRLLLFLTTAGFLVLTTWALAQEGEKTTSPLPDDKTATTSAVDEEKIKSLKEKLATKVAQLRENQTRGFFGELASLSKTGFTLVTRDGEIKVRYGEDTAIYKLGTKTITAKSADLKNMLSASVIGLYDKEDGIHEAKIILIQTYPSYVEGEIVTVDKEEGSITLKTKKDETVQIDYEKTTKAQEYNKNEEKLAKSGLSRISSGDRIHVWATTSEEDNQKLTAERILRLPKELFTKDSGESLGASASPPASASPSATSKTSPKVSPKTSPPPSPTP